MSTPETSAEVKAKILLDEANLAFSETSERKDSAGERNLEGSAWEEGRMEGEYDEADYQKILELQMRAAIACDDHPELEEKNSTVVRVDHSGKCRRSPRDCLKRREYHDIG